jgi:hypothetical protein
MLQRNQDEFELFQKMDSERIMNQKPGQARLMEEHELPGFLTKTVEEAQDEMDDADRSKIYGKGNRSRREVLDCCFRIFIVAHLGKLWRGTYRGTMAQRCRQWRRR